MVNVSLEHFIESEEWTGKEGLLSDGRYKSTWDAIGGCWNIGPGLTKGITKNTIMTKQQIDEAFAKELIPFKECIDENVKIPLTGNEYIVLVSFAYNVGNGNFLKSTLLKVLNEGKTDQVPGQLMRWVHGRATGSKEIPGLVHRREAEVALWKSPSVPDYATVHPSEDVSSLPPSQYVPHYDPNHPVPKNAVTLEMIMSEISSLVKVPLYATTAVISQAGQKAVTATQGVLLSFVTYVLSHFSSAWDLFGVNSSTLSVYACTAVIALIEWYKHEWVKNSNDTTLTIINSLEDELKKISSEAKG